LRNEDEKKRALTPQHVDAVGVVGAASARRRKSARGQAKGRICAARPCESAQQGSTRPCVARGVDVARRRGRGWEGGRVVVVRCAGAWRRGRRRRAGVGGGGGGVRRRALLLLLLLLLCLQLLLLTTRRSGVVARGGGHCARGVARAQALFLESRGGATSCARVVGARGASGRAGAGRAMRHREGSCRRAWFGKRRERDNEAQWPGARGGGRRGGGKRGGGVVVRDEELFAFLAPARNTTHLFLDRSRSIAPPSIVKEAAFGTEARNTPQHTQANTARAQDPPGSPSLTSPSPARTERERDNTPARATHEQN
jgi:hypothetical protein